MSFERNYVKTCSKNSAARFHDARLSSWGILVGIAAKLTDGNFGYNVDWGFSLRVQDLHGGTDGPDS